MNERKRALQMGDSALPPPGDERREVLSRRRDELEEASERLSSEQEVFAIDPKALTVDRELAHNYNPATLSIMNVTSPQPGYEYCWANAVSQSGLQVMMKKYDGWKVVSGSDPENMEHKHTDGTRRIADTLLMRIPLERKKALDERDEVMRKRVQSGVSAELEELGRKYHGRGIRVHTPNESTDPDSRYRDRGFSEQHLSSDPRRRLVEKEAARQIGELSREKIPGVPLPGETK
jgi:hypothetical protein